MIGHYIYIYISEYMNCVNISEESTKSKSIYFYHPNNFSIIVNLKAFHSSI